MSLLNQLTVEDNKAKVYTSLLDEHAHNPNTIYFLNSAQAIYINNFFMNIFFYICVKAVQLLFYMIRNYSEMAKKVYMSIMKSSKLWSLYSMLVESNVSIIVFCCALQFLVCGYFDSESKLNFAFCVLLLLVVFLYSTCFYPIIYHTERRSSAETILCHTNYHSQSYFF